MKTDIITIYSDLKGREEAIDAAERFIAYNGIEGKAAMHIRLLTEEAVGMAHGIMDGFKRRDEGVISMHNAQCTMLG